MRNGHLTTSRPRLLGLAGVVTAAIMLLSGCSGAPVSHAPDTKPKAPAAAPAATAVSSIDPASGSVSGGTITISGRSLTAVQAVSVGGQDAPITDAKTNALTVAVPNQPNYQASKADVALKGAGGVTLLTLAGAYTYQVLTPVDRQLNYALTYWQTYNTATYGDLNSVGGDCANFVSQTLAARGWTQNSQWYNKNAASKWSPAWGYVPSMDDYFASTPSLGLTRYSLDQRSSIKVGDIVMFDWNNNNSLDHVQIVSQVQHVGGKIVIKMAGHNTDSDYRDLDQTITVDHPGATGHFWSFNS